VSSAVVVPRHSGPNTQRACYETTTSSGCEILILLSLRVNGLGEPLTALLDTGATNNFVRASCLEGRPSIKIQESDEKLTLRLADGKPRQLRKRFARLKYTLDDLESEDVFLAIDMDTRFDCILGMPWLQRHRPQIDWERRSIDGFKTVEDEMLAHLDPPAPGGCRSRRSTPRFKCRRQGK